MSTAEIAAQPGTTEIPAQVGTQDGRPVSKSLAAAFGLKARHTVPDGWSVTSKGVYLVRPTKNGDQYEQAATGPVLITRVLEAPDGSQSVEIAWTYRGRVIRRMVPKEIARRGRDLVKALGPIGLPTSDSYAPMVEKWLLAYEDANAAHLPLAQLRRWLGWQPDGTFLATPEGTDFEPTHESQQKPAHGHRASGTLAGWKETAKKLEGLPIPRLCIAAGLAAPLLRVIGVGSFAVDLSGFSGTGKTSSGECGISTFSHPLEIGGAAFSWATTPYMIEERLNLARGLPVLLDESQHIKPEDRPKVAEMLYLLPTNRGRARAKGWNSGLEWETVVISTGEQSLLTMSAHQGLSARVLRVEGSPFPDAATANAARAGFTQHHGQSGPAFVARLCKELATEDGSKRLTERHADLAAKLTGDNAISARRSRMVAALALAETLAAEWDVLPYTPMQPDQWMDLFSASSESDNRPEQALNVVRELVGTRMHELWSSNSADLAGAGMVRVPTQWLGAHVVRDGEKRVAIRPQAIREALSRAGFEFDAVIGQWMVAGYIEPGRNRGKPSPTRSVRLGEATPRLIEFTRAGFPVGDTPADA